MSITKIFCLFLTFFFKSYDIASNDCSEGRPIDLTMNLYKNFIQ